MTRQSVVPVPGIDLAFRPATYFWPLPAITHLLSRIKGAERKLALEKMIASGRLGDVPGFLAESGLSREDRLSFGRLHPNFMGGEYLPDLAPTEVMIARITIASTTQDVTSVYARRGRGRIHYRVVDEYEGDTLFEKRTRISTRPLTLGQLESFFNGAWPLLAVLDMNFADTGYDLRKMLRFVDVDSQFYPDLEDLYVHRITSWAQRQRAALELDQEQDLEA